jgi:glutamine amidotransferase
MQTVAVVDYGMSNLCSVAKALEAAAAGSTRVVISGEPDQLRAAERVVFPGQGAIGRCLSTLEEHGLTSVLIECLRGKPYLGICLGMQCLLDRSAEDGGTATLGILPGEVRRFPDGRPDAGGRRCKVPHMGWNEVRQARAHPLWKGIADGARFYFVHSYYADPAEAGDLAGSTDYIVPFASAIARDNLFAVQFHPEKSQRNGLALLRNFLAWKP